jgi:hypothetical protein
MVTYTEHMGKVHKTPKTRFSVRVPPLNTPKTIPGTIGSVKFLGGIENNNPGSQNTRTSCNLADLKHSLNQIMAISEYIQLPCK